MPTHIRADSDQIAPHVLLPGDPGRARYVAQTFLTDVSCYSDYRQLLGFTGLFEGIPCSVQTTGMGAPSAAIICEELAMLGARTLLRIGTCGTIQDHVELGDLIIVERALGENGATRDLTGQRQPALRADEKMVKLAQTLSRSENIPAHQGSVATLDLFYDPSTDRVPRLKADGILALEMEASMILAVAARHKIRAGGLLTVSDKVQQEVRASDDIIQGGVDRMAQIGLGVFTQLSGS